MNTALAYLAAATLEIAGCYAFWAWLRLGRSAWWVLPGLLALTAFAAVLTRVDADHAGRAYAAYGGIYIVGSLLWLWLVDGARPDRGDLIGSGLCLIGAAVIVLAPRTSAA